MVTLCDNRDFNSQLYPCQGNCGDTHHMLLRRGAGSV